MVIHSFGKSKSIGNCAEKLWQDWFSLKYGKIPSKTDLNTDKTLHIDFYVDGIGLQVKGDQWLNSTNNFCFQTSKIINCEAKYLYFVDLTDNDTIYRFNVENLKETWEVIKQSSRQIQVKNYNKNNNYESENFLLSKDWALANLKCKVYSIAQENLNNF